MKSDKPFRIGTYNVLIPRDDHPDKGTSSWLKRRDSVVDTIDSEFDLVGLQECSFRIEHQQGDFLVSELRSRGWEVYAPTTGFSDEFHRRVPIFYRKDRFELKAAKQLQVSSWFPIELMQVPSLENRYASFVSGLVDGSKPLVFGNTHLQHTTHSPSAVEASITAMKRQEAAGVLVDELQEPLNTGTPVALVGDFNAHEPFDAFRKAGLFDSSSLAQQTERFEHNSFHDWEYPKFGEHLDRIYVTGSLASGTHRVGDALCSDHYPVSYSLKS